jgi:hypothetical protein
VRLRAEDGAVGIGEFFIAAVVAVPRCGIDEFLGGGEGGLRGFPRVRLLAEGEAAAR